MIDMIVFFIVFGFRCFSCLCCQAVGCLRVSVKAWRCLHQQDLTDAQRRMLAEQPKQGF